MDPIHPIRFEPPNIPPVAPLPRTARVERDAGNQRDPDDRRRQRRRRPAPSGDPERPAPSGEDLGPHIDITA